MFLYSTFGSPNSFKGKSINSVVELIHPYAAPFSSHASSRKFLIRKKISLAEDLKNNALVILLQSIFTDIIQYPFPCSSCLVIKFRTYLIDGRLLVSCGGSKGTKVYLSSAFYSFHPVVTFQLFSCFSPQTSQPGPSKEKHKTHQASKPPVPHIYIRRKICRRKGGGDSELFIKSLVIFSLLLF